jgi:hypothetical protein
MSEPENDFLVVAEAAAAMRMAKRTLDNHRCKGTGPKFRRHGGRIVYRRADLLEWSEQWAAPTAVQKSASNSSSSPPIGRSSHRPSGIYEEQRASAAVECQPKRSNRPLLGDKASAGKRPIGRRPPT